MKKALRISTAASIVLVLLLLNLKVVFAHDWGQWHWHTNPLHIWVWGSNQPEAVAAIADWDSHIQHMQLHTQFKGHTDISVFGANSGDTGWWGLATIENYSFDWWHLWTWSRIEHAHATYNSFYGGTTGTGSGSDVRGVLCQEIGHTFGLDHSNTGDCMGKGYFNSINVTGSHNWADMDAKY